MSDTNDFSEGGIVIHAQRSGDALDELLDAKGKPVVVRKLSAAHWIASDWFFVGGVTNVHLTVKGTISGGMASVKLRLEGKRRDAKNDTSASNTFGRPYLVDTVRTDSPAAGPAEEQTIAAADLQHGTGAGTDQVSDWDGTADGASAAAEALDVRLLTPDALMSGFARVLLLATGAPAANDKITVSVNRG